MVPPRRRAVVLRRCVRLRCRAVPSWAVLDAAMQSGSGREGRAGGLWGQGEGRRRWRCGDLRDPLLRLLRVQVGSRGPRVFPAEQPQQSSHRMSAQSHARCLSCDAVEGAHRCDGDDSQDASSKQVCWSPDDSCICKERVIVTDMTCHAHHFRVVHAHKATAGDASSCPRCSSTSSVPSDFESSTPSSQHSIATPPPAPGGQITAKERA